MRKVVLDTDIMSEIMRRRNWAVFRRANEYSEVYEVFTLTAISVHEIVYGLSGNIAPRQLYDAREVFDENEVVLPTLDDYERSGAIRGAARRRGVQLSATDCLIGTVAERLGLPVATGNTAHFQAMIDVGLRIEIEDWRQPILSP